VLPAASPTAVLPSTLPAVVASPAVATPSAAPVASSTISLPVASNSGSGCTAGITDGNQWIRYTVKPGDTLSSISQCFSLNGFEALYQDNISLLGPNPNLIHPGQVITIVDGKMTASST
jgi:LysM repeat protein